MQAPNPRTRTLHQETVAHSQRVLALNRKELALHQRKEPVLSQKKVLVLSQKKVLVLNQKVRVLNQKTAAWP